MRSASTGEWLDPPEELRLDANDVHVWRFSLDEPSSLPHEMERALAEDELLRASRFRYQRDRARFVAARFTLRTLLSGYLGGTAAELRFRYSERGKPELAGSSLRFNLSHSEAMALVAVARWRQIGVDVEAVREDFDYQPISSRYFSVRENALLDATSEEERAAGFFRIWTAKEAYSKAIGAGLQHLNGFDSVDLPAAGWSLLPVWTDARYAGTVAVQGVGLQFACWHWPRRHNTETPV